MIWLLPKSLRGNHIENKKVRMLRTRSLVIDSDPPYHMHIDGEYMGDSTRRLVVELKHRVLPVVCMREGPHHLAHPPEKIL